MQTTQSDSDRGCHVGQLEAVLRLVDAAAILLGREKLDRFKKRGKKNRNLG
jgi:hypothetical protein